MVARLVSDAIWRNRWGYATIGLLLMMVWLMFAISLFNPLSISFAAASLIATVMLGPTFAMGAMGLRELRHLPATSRDLWRSTWIVATVVCVGFLLITKTLAFFLVSVFGGTPAVSLETILLSSVYDFAWAGVMLWTFPSIGYLAQVAEGRGTLAVSLVGAASIGMIVAGVALPILASDALPARLNEFTPMTIGVLVAAMAIALRTIAWIPTRGVLAGERSLPQRSAPARAGVTRIRYADRLTGISRVAVPHIVTTLALGIAATLALTTYGVISGAGPWWFAPPTPQVFDSGEDHGLAYFVLLPVMVTVMVSAWMPWARLLKVLPLATRQINALLVITPFATWTILWVLGYSVYALAFGAPQTLRLGLAFGTAAMTALVHAAMLRFQGGSGTILVMMAIGGLLPSLVKVGLRDDDVSQIAFALISVSALCAAAVHQSPHAHAVIVVVAFVSAATAAVRRAHGTAEPIGVRAGTERLRTSVNRHASAVVYLPRGET